MSLRFRTSAAARAAAVTCIVTLTSAALAGDLNPPPGAIAPTMLRLDQIEPRIIVNDLPGAADAVHVISAPGNYYCTADITAGAGLNGILVTADDVTLDLNGFTLRGLPGSLDGILVDAPTPVTFAASGYIKIGDIKGEVASFGGNGVTVVNGASVSVVRLRVRDCGGHGVQANILSGMLFDEYESRRSAMNGIDITLVPGAGASSLIAVVIITGLTSLGNAGHGVVVRGSGFPPPPPGAIGGDGKADISIFRPTSMANGGDGVRFEFDNTIRPSITMRGVRTIDNVGSGVNSVLLSPDTLYDVDIQDIDASFNGGDGLSVSGNVVVVGARLNNNTGSGVVTQTLDKATPAIYRLCAASGNGGSGFDQLGGSPRYDDCTATKNLTHGFFYNGRSAAIAFDSYMADWRRCVATNNGLDGFSLFADSVVVADSSSVGNLRDGIRLTASDASLSKCDSKRNAGNGFFSDGRSIAGAAAVYDVDYGRCVASNNGLDGFKLFASSAVVADSTSSSNLGDGMSISAPDSSVRNCKSNRNAGNGYFFDGRSVGAASIVYMEDSHHNRASNNGLDGFKLFIDGAVLSECSATSNLGDGFDFVGSDPLLHDDFVRFLHVVSTSNGGNGVRATGGTLYMFGGYSSSNTSAGVRLTGGPLYCYRLSLTRNGGGGCIATDQARLQMDECTFDNNTGNGLTTSSSIGVLTGPVTLRRCSFTGNTSSGCSIADSTGGQVDECSAFGNGLLGIEVLSPGHLLTGIAAGRNPAGNINAIPGNAVGPQVGAAVIGGDNNFANPSP